MALIWADSFEHYGTGTTGRTNMLAGPYGDLGSSALVSGTQSRTGTYSLRISQAPGDRQYARRVIPGATRNVIGFGFGLFMEELPPNITNANNGPHGVFFRSGSAFLVSLAYRSDGSIEVFKGTSLGSGDGTSLGSTDPGVLTASAFHHVEVAVRIDSIVGEVEVRVDGVTVFVRDSLDLGSSNVTNIEWGALTSANYELVTYYDDVFAWDDTGDVNNDFLGQQRVYTLWPEGNESTQDWVVVGAASGYEAINEIVPDGDTTYISGMEVDDVSEFSLGELPTETALIAGVYVPTMARLSDAGTGNMQVSLVSEGQASDGPDVPLTTAYTYWDGVHEVDPNTGNPWTKAALEAAILRVKKTA